MNEIIESKWQIFEQGELTLKNVPAEKSEKAIKMLYMEHGSL